MKACPECRLIYEEGKICTECKVDLSDRFYGMIIIVDPIKSEIAKLIEKTLPGKYAVKVK